MSIPAPFMKLFSTRSRKRNRIVVALASILIVAIATFAHAFFSVNSSYLRVSTNADRSNSRGLSSATLSGDVYIFLSLADSNIKKVEYYMNPQGSLTSSSLVGSSKIAPFDLGGQASVGRLRAFNSKTLNNGTNQIVTKVFFRNGYIHHDFTWFNVNNTAPAPTTTTTTTLPPVTVPPTTLSPTTTTTQPHTDHCVPGTIMDGHGPCIDSNYIPQPAKGTSITRFDRKSPVTSNTGEAGAFRTRCDFSHMNNDDPVLYPNQKGRAHLHTFFGNTLTDAFSTSQSLINSGNSTCSGGLANRSSYWVPTMIDGTNGRPIIPNDDRGQYNSDLEIYYKLGYQGVGYKDVRAFPDGLQMIAGNAATATGPTNGSQVAYWCEGSVDTDRTRNLEGPSIPRCVRGQVLVMHINFPQCWDGKNLTSTNGRSHMAYGQWQPGENEYTRGCPASHPVGLPSLAMFVRYRVFSADSSAWRLSSDSYANGPGGYSGHGDYVFAWRDGAFDTVVQRCYRALVDCGYQLGDGREPTSPRFLPDTWWGTNRNVSFSSPESRVAKLAGLNDEETIFCVLPRKVV